MLNPDLIPNDKPSNPQKIEIQLLLSEIFRSITRKINSGVTYEKILDFVYESLSLVIPFDRMGIALIEGEIDNRQVCVKWIRSKIPAKHLTHSYCAPLNGSSLQRIFETGQPRIINDLEKYFTEHPQSKSSELAIKDGIRSSMTCPLRANNQNVGIVFFSSLQKHTYEKEDLRTFLEVANELSVIIEHGRLKKFFESNVSTSKSLSMTLHDLKSPLSIVQGLLEMTQIEDWYNYLSADEKKVFLIMQKNTKYMFELINELSELRHLDFKDQQVKTEDVVLSEFCAELETRESPAALRKGIKLKVNLNRCYYETVRLDPVKIFRVLDNLLSNAFKFSPHKTEVTVDVTCEKDRLTFSVTDQGPGIPENEIKNLFKEFGKTSVLPTAGESSTGLGLAIAKKIVEQLGGEISVKSEVKKGSIFTFWLPIYFHS